jgi:transcriptional adapter 2-alpha
MFSRFHSASDHEALVEGLIKARKLRKQIELFQLYRSMGIHTLEDARRYEIERKKRESDSKTQKMREVTPYLFETGRLSSSSSSSSSKASSSNNGSQLDINAATATSSRSSRVRQDQLHSNNDLNTDNNQRKIESVSLDISKAPLVDCLVSSEIELCKELPMLPSHYLAVKDAIIRFFFFSSF